MEVRDQNGLTEAEFIRQYDPNRYEKPAVTVDKIGRASCRERV